MDRMNEFERWINGHYSSAAARDWVAPQATCDELVELFLNRPFQPQEETEVQRVATRRIGYKRATEGLSPEIDALVDKILAELYRPERLSVDYFKNVMHNFSAEIARLPNKADIDSAIYAVSNTLTRAMFLGDNYWMTTPVNTDTVMDAIENRCKDTFIPHCHALWHHHYNVVPVVRVKRADQ